MAFRLLLYFLLSLLLLLLLHHCWLLTLNFLLLLLLGLLLLLLLRLLLLGKEGNFGRGVLQEEAIRLGEVVLDLWQMLDVFVPAEEIIVLKLLLVSEINDIVVEVSKHVEVCEGDVVAYEEGSIL